MQYNKSQIRLAEWGPMISNSLDPLQSTWLASDLHQTLTRHKVSSAGYRHLAPTSSTALGEQALVQCCDRCLNINAGYVQIWCVPPTTHVPCIHLGQNKVLGISVSVNLFLFNVLVWSTYSILFSTKALKHTGSHDSLSNEHIRYECNK
jgi:hypothetical protein